VCGVYAGLRPLVADPADDGASKSTINVSREHRVRVDADGLVRIGGGKLTTYRLMARDAVDAALDAAEGAGASARRPSATARTPLIGAAEADTLDRLRANLASRLGRDTATAGRSRALAERLVDRHGTRASAVVDLGAQLDPDGRLGHLQPLGSTIDHLAVEIVWAAREELALDLGDVLTRRMRLAPELPDRGEAIAPAAVRTLGAELEWDDGRRQREIDRYLAAAHRAFDVPLSPN
jgi:glycerol-3-phosphate dehydrogenase